MNGRVLVVDDDREMCELVQDALQGNGHTVSWRTNIDCALEVARAQDLDVVISDIRLGREDGLQLCKQLVENRPDVPVILITAFGSMETAVAAIRSGAYDFITKPLDLPRLELTVNRALRHARLEAEVKHLQAEVRRTRAIAPLIGESASMRRVYQLIDQVSDTDITVLVTGESGTGKELVARAIHDRGARSAAPFVAINCAAMPVNLLESELFGHVRGAFTDARRARDGLFVQASGGTLFLDEIGEMPLEMQAKLLRVLQEERVRPVGGDEERPFDTRIIAATNRDLESDIEEGRFREDLFYRIHVVRIELPSLRSRGRDILLLAQAFLDQTAERIGKDVSKISPAAAQKLLDYDWPGNVRELANCIERAVALTKLDTIVPDDLPEKVRQHESTRMVIAGADPDEMPTLLEVEARYVRRVLQAVGGSKTHAARVLGIDRRTLYRRLDRYKEMS